MNVCGRLRPLLCDLIDLNVCAYVCNVCDTLYVYGWLCRKMTYDYKKSNAEQKKHESRQLEEIKTKGRELSEQEKRQRVEEEKRRYVCMYVCMYVCTCI